MNLADPELELIDPTPNVHMLFINFDKEFFWTKLASRAVVRWSKRMYSCAGICSYEGRGGLCDIALSEPLLKLRPRKDLIETLLHEMIHAFLFVTNRDQDRDGHGPNFQAHMNRINKSAGLNISIYHSFHDEVELYQTHWWRCNGPCQKMRPHYGIVRRSMNRAPGPSDYWWNYHKKKCGGTFVKIKEPDNFKARQKSTDSNKKNGVNKSNGDITKYINNNIQTINNLSNPKINGKPVLKDSNSNTKSSTFVVGKKGVVYNPTASKPLSQEITIFTGSGHTLNNSKHISDSRNVTEHVRNIWANKEIPSVVNKPPTKKLETTNLKKPSKIIGPLNPSKHKANDNSLQSPPAKIKKIDDYFKATSLLKDLYGDDFKLTQSHNNTKLVAVPVKLDLVDCPTCNAKIDSTKINEHLDECLNREIIKKLSQEAQVEINRSNCSSSNLQQVIGSIPQIPASQGSLEITTNNIVDLTNNFDTVNDKIGFNKTKRRSDSPTTVQPIKIDNEITIKKVIKDSNRTTEIKKPILNNIRKSDNFISKDRGDYVFNFVKTETSLEVESKLKTSETEPVPSTSKDSKTFEQTCPCCGTKFDKTVDEHLEECLVFSQNDKTDSPSLSNYDKTTIFIDDNENDDKFDESQEFNASGTKTPCPCCMMMVEEIAMNDHLDICLGII